MVFKARKQQIAPATALKPAFADTHLELTETNRKRLEPLLLAVGEEQEDNMGGIRRRVRVSHLGASRGHDQRQIPAWVPGSRRQDALSGPRKASS